VTRSARVELGGFSRRSYERLRGGRRSLGQSLRAPPDRGLPAVGRTAWNKPAIDPHLRKPAWWECYLSFLLRARSLASARGLIAYLPPRVSQRRLPVSTPALCAERVLLDSGDDARRGELQHGLRAGFLERKGLEAGMVGAAAPSCRPGLERALPWVRLADSPAVVATALLNFASLSGTGRLRK